MIPKEKPKVVPDDSVWHAGEGGGSWFAFHPHSRNEYIVERYSPKGYLEFRAIYYCNTSHFFLDKPISVGYLSHYEFVNVIQNGLLATLRRK